MWYGRIRQRLKAWRLRDGFLSLFLGCVVVFDVLSLGISWDKVFRLFCMIGWDPGGSRFRVVSDNFAPCWCCWMFFDIRYIAPGKGRSCNAEDAHAVFGALMWNWLLQWVVDSVMREALVQRPTYGALCASARMRPALESASAQGQVHPQRP